MNSNRIAIGVQARISSQRFPGKVLAPFLGSTVLGQLIENLSYQSLPVFVVTSDHS